MGLMVDQAKPGRYGTTNYCNMARHFFKDPSHSTNITGLSEMLISTCAVILQTLSHGHTGNLEAFNQYVKETAGHLVKNYPCYYMPVSVHKSLNAWSKSHTSHHYRHPPNKSTIRRGTGVTA
jgi:hypothetical protein